MEYVVFLIQCPDQKGLVSRISTFFYEKSFNILHCQQYTDIAQNQYFMRLKLDLDSLPSSRGDLEREFEEFAGPLKLEWSVHYSDHLQRVAILAILSAEAALASLWKRSSAWRFWANFSGRNFKATLRPRRLSSAL